MLDSTHVMISYKDEDNSGYGTSIIGTISGTSITFGSESVFNSGSTFYVPSVMLDSTHVCVSYRSGSSGPGTSIIGTIDGTSITWGSKYVFSSGTVYDASSVMIDSTHVLVSYNDADNNYYGTSRIGTISNGDEIAWGSEYVFNSAYTAYSSSVMLDSTHVIISYMDSDPSSYGTSIIGTISNEDEISWGSEYVFNDSGNTTDISSAMLDSTHVMISYRDHGNSYYGTSIIGTISNGDEIAWGSEYVFNSGNTYYTSSVTIDSTHVLVSYRNAGNSNYGTSIVGTIDGTSITWGSEVVFNNGTTAYISSVMSDSTHVLVSYQDFSNNKYGTSCILY